MKTYVGVDVQVHIFLILALVGGESSASRSGRFTPWVRVLCIHWIEGWVDSRAGRGIIDKRKVFILHDSKPK
jgi:hypothetical protein